MFNQAVLFVIPLQFQYAPIEKTGMEQAQNFRNHSVEKKMGRILKKLS